MTLNGKPHQLRRGATVADLLKSLPSISSGVAVALNETVVPQNRWNTTALQDLDRVEVLVPSQGG
ncbi:MAG: sulfur carrier protein ThiS [Acidimicrobiales bacterium]